MLIPNSEFYDQFDVAIATCPYEAVAGNERQFRSTYDDTVQECVIGMMYEPLICDCLQTSDSKNVFSNLQ